jgi:hypothetical protein
MTGLFWKRFPKKKFSHVLSLLRNLSLPTPQSLFRHLSFLCARTRFRPPHFFRLSSLVHPTVLILNFCLVRRTRRWTSPRGYRPSSRLRLQSKILGLPLLLSDKCCPRISFLAFMRFATKRFPSSTAGDPYASKSVSQFHHSILVIMRLLGHLNER